MACRLLRKPLKYLQNWPEACQWPEACGKDTGSPGSKQVIASQSLQAETRGTYVAGACLNEKHQQCSDAGSVRELSCSLTGRGDFREDS